MLTANPRVNRQIDHVERVDNVLKLISDFGTLFLEPQSECIVRVTFSVKGSRSDKDRPGVIARDPYTDWSFADRPDAVELVLPQITVCVSKKSGSVCFFDRDRNPIFSEDPRNPREYEAFETFRLADAPQKTRIIDTADGKKEVVEDARKVSDGESYHFRLNFKPGDEAIYGLGQQEKGSGSLRGKTLYIHQANRKIAASLFVSTGGYGILADTYAPMIFHDGPDGSYLYLEADRELDYYFLAGGMNDVIRGYRFLTGKAALLPRWAFGYVQSQERYESQQEILDTVRRFREEGIGLDCIVLDWMSWKDNEWGQKSYDPQRFPDPADMIRRLHEDHVHFMISIWPTMAEGTADHAEFARRKLFLPACSVYDALKEEARELYFDQLRQTHFRCGTDAWWCDSSEPITPEWNHAFRPEEGALFQEYCSEVGLRIPCEYTNSYPLYHAMGIYENQRKAMEQSGMEEKRVCNLTRSSYTGQQRYGTVMWSGDTAASWDTFRDQIAIGLHYSASGMPFWTNDIGAFFVKQADTWYWNGDYDDTADNKGYCELYVRWFQYAAFLPMFRAHGTDFRREPWTFRGEFYDALIAAIRLRYSLMPYIYSEAGKVWLKDNSFIRWLAFDHTDDRKTWEITDQFLFGENLMVCPVVEPMYYDIDGNPLKDVEKNRSVYFPAGCDWRDFYTEQRYAGGSTCRVEAGLDRIPVFVREGSLIPVRKPALSTEEQNDEITFRRFSDAGACYDLYEDDGDGYGYERGEYRLRRECV
ncbi:MAG: glycoside hydrolase family 31 protein [Lachnospiraceae bacterium]|nr:glycoside hydrolase family 31 protein [Lachnospiraceae bacterium]